MPDDLEQRVGGVELGNAGKSAPWRLLLYFGMGIFSLQFAWHVAGETLLNRLHAQFQLTLYDLFAQPDVRVYPWFGKRSAIVLQVLHPLPGGMRRSCKEMPCLFIRETMFQQRVVPHGFQTDNREGHVDGVHCHIVQLALPSFPVPPCCRVTHGAIVHVNTILAIDDVTGRFGRERKRLRQVELIAEPGNMCMASIF